MIRRAVEWQVKQIALRCCRLSKTRYRVERDGGQVHRAIRNKLAFPCRAAGATRYKSANWTPRGRAGMEHAMSQAETEHELGSES